MIELIAFMKHLDTKTTTLTEITPVPDPTIHIEENIAYLSALSQIFLVYGGAEGLTQMRLDAPSLRRLALYEVFPVNNDVRPENKIRKVLLPANPLVLEKGEGLKVLINEPYNDNKDVVALLGICDGPISPVVAPFFTVRFEGVITNDPWEWGNAELTVVQTLPVGRYQVIGGACRAPGGVAFRMVPIGEAQRPGSLCASKADDIGFPELRAGKMGAWFEFDSGVPPSLEVLAPANVGSYQLYLDLIKIG